MVLDIGDVVTEFVVFACLVEIVEFGGTETDPEFIVGIVVFKVVVFDTKVVLVGGIIEWVEVTGLVDEAVLLRVEIAVLLDEDEGEMTVLVPLVDIFAEGVVELVEIVGMGLTLVVGGVVFGEEEAMGTTFVTFVTGRVDVEVFNEIGLRFIAMGEGRAGATTFAVEFV